MGISGKGAFEFNSTWLRKPRREGGRGGKFALFYKPSNTNPDYASVSKDWFFPAPATQIIRYVNTSSTPGGDGTTNATVGANRAWASANEAFTNAPKNIASLRQQLTIYASGTVADTTPVDVPATFDTDPQCYLEYVVQQPDRHSGVYTTSKYRIEVTDGTAFIVRTPFFRMTGVQIQVSKSMGYVFGANGIEFRSTAMSDVRISACILKGVDASGVGVHRGIESGLSTGTGYIAYVWNNTIYGWTSSGIYNDSQEFYAYHNTVDSCAIGYIAGFGSVFRTENSLITNCTDPFNGTFNAASDYNVTSGASAPGANSKLMQSITYAGVGDYHTADTDVYVNNSLYADNILPITVDIDGDSRPSSGNVCAGSDEFVASGAAGPLDPFGASGFFGA